MNKAEGFAQPRVGWWVGFENMLRKESQEWWGSGRWLFQALIWLVITTAFPILLLWVLPDIPSAGQGTTAAPVFDRVDAALNLFLLAAMTATSLGIALMAQGQVIDELLLGTAEWVLSKPVSRSAFLLAKMAATLLVVLVLMITLPGVFLYGLLFLKTGAPFPIQQYILAEGLVLVHAVFYLALALLMSVASRSRALVIGSVAASVFGSQLLLQLFPALINVTPWGLVIWVRMITSGAPVTADLLLPLSVTAIAILACTALSIAIFQRVEL